jgi:hypothetical protein
MSKIITGRGCDGKYYFYLAMFFNLFEFIYTQTKYLETLQTSFSKLNNAVSTVVISESIDIGTCTCDLTPNTCDYLCCCDTECPTTITDKWISDPNNICLDKSIYIDL